MNTGTQLTKSGALAHLTTLEQVVDDYVNRFQNKFDSPSDNHSAGHDDPVVDFTKESPNLAVAIERAVAGRRRDGKLFKKGSCVRTSSKNEMAANLLKRSREVRAAKDFEQLYDIVEAAATWGIGRMTMYAVTERLGAYLGDIKPQAYLYIHAGPLEGWQRLIGHRTMDHRIKVTDLPPAFRLIELYHVENMLCEYRLILHSGMLGK